MTKSNALAAGASRLASVLLGSLPAGGAFVAPRHPGGSPAINDGLSPSRALRAASWVGLFFVGVACGSTRDFTDLPGSLGGAGETSDDATSQAGAESEGGSPDGGSDGSGTGGASGGGGGSGGGNVGAGGNGGSAGNPGAGGASAGAASKSGGAAGTSTGGAGSAGNGGSAGHGGGGAATGGSSPGGASAGGAPSYPTTPPVADANSTLAVSKPPAGYKVTGNFAYGPLTAQRLDVMYPTAAGPGGPQTLPAVLMFHGGAWTRSPTDDGGAGKAQMSAFYDRFLNHGFIVFNAEYRVNDGTAAGAPAPAAVRDALLAAEWCWKYLDYFKGDRERFVVTGASAGAHLALMVGMATPEAMLGPTAPANYKIAAIVDNYGPADIEAELDGVAKDWIPTDLANRAGIAKLVNPINYVRPEVPQLLALQGSEDTTVPYADSWRLVNLLFSEGALATIHRLDGAGHGYTNGVNGSVVDGWPEAEATTFDWLTAHGIGK